MSTPRQLHNRLTQSTDLLVWAAVQIPTGRQHVMPLPVFGDWSVLRIVFHLSWYERNIVLPTLQAWSEDGLPEGNDLDEDDEAHAWMRATQVLDVLLREFVAGRDALRAALDALPETAWEAPRETSWGMVTAGWVTAHVIQHTLEYADIVMRMGLYWDMHLAAQKQARRDVANNPDAADTSDVP